MPRLLVGLAGLWLGQPEGISTLEWHSARGCPPAEEGRAAVEHLLEEPLDAPRPVPVAVEVVLEPVHEGAQETVQEGGWALKLTLQTTTGRRERTLEGRDCGELAQTAALLAAVAIEPGTHAQAQEVELPPEPEEDLETVTPVVEPMRSSSVRKEADRRRWGWFVGASAGLDIATLGRLGGAVGGSTRVRWRALGVDLGILHRFAHRHTVGDDGDARLWTTSGTLDVCGVPRTAWVEFPLCGGVEAGVLAGRSIGVVRPHLDRTAWVAFRGRLGVVAWVHRRVGLTLAGVLVVPGIRPRATVDGRGVVFHVPPIAGAVNLGIDVRVR